MFEAATDGSIKGSESLNSRRSRQDGTSNFNDADPLIRTSSRVPHEFDDLRMTAARRIPELIA